MAIVHKTPNLFMYVNGYLDLITSHKNFQLKIDELEKKMNQENLEEVERRVNYYFKIKTTIDKSKFQYHVKDLRKPTTPKSYFFDTFEYAKYFPDNLPIQYLFGDITHVPEIPSIVKSRPISENNQNSILLNLNKTRHFVYVEKDKPFLEKNNKLIGRGGCTIGQKHRYDFYEKYFENKLCDLGQTNKKNGNPKWIKPKISINKHLDYKFILSLQGNDVATNLKWIMSSNSIAVMPKPTIETWYMEGNLKKGVHFIAIDDTYSNLEEVLAYYIENPKECLEIINNAKLHFKQFTNKNKEDLIALLVLKRFLVA